MTEQKVDALVCESNLNLSAAKSTHMFGWCKKAPFKTYTAWHTSFKYDKKGIGVL